MRWPNPFEPPAALIDEVRSLIPPNPLFIVSWYCVRGLLQAIIYWNHALCLHTYSYSTH